MKKEKTKCPTCDYHKGRRVGICSKHWDKSSPKEKEWVKDFDKKFAHNSVCSPTGLIEIKSFFHSQLEKILEEVKNCVPEKREADSYINMCSCGVDECLGQCVGEFNSCREQTLKALEDLMK